MPQVLSREMLQASVGRSWRCEWLLIRKASGGKEPVQAKRLREGRGKEVVSRGVC